MNEMKDQWDRWASTYSSSYTSELVKIEDKILGDYLFRNGLFRGSVLDLGCGDGLFIDLAKSHNSLPSNYTGMDISKNMCAKAFERPEFQDEGYHLEVCNMMDAPNVLDGERFDSIISIHGGFSYVKNPELVADLVDTMLSPGGRAMFMVFAPRWGMRQSIISEGNGIIAYRVLYTPELIRGVFDHPNLIEIEVRPFTVLMDRVPRFLWWAEDIAASFMPRSGNYISIIVEKKNVFNKTRNW